MRRFLLLVSLAAILGCRKHNDAGTLAMSWTGADTGRIEAPATARWCAADSVMEIVSVEADSGGAIAIFPPDSVRPGVYPVGAPRQQLARPWAGVALRRFGENLILGYYSLSGTVTVDSGSPLRGSLQATLKSVNTGDQVNVTGHFSGITVAGTDDPRCGAAIANPADSGVR